MTIDTSGFYRMEGLTLSYVPNYAYGAEYEIRREDRDTYTYPRDGWNWFESEELAREAYHLPPPEPIAEPSTP